MNQRIHTASPTLTEVLGSAWPSWSLVSAILSSVSRPFSSDEPRLTRMACRVPTDSRSGMETLLRELLLLTTRGSSTPPCVRALAARVARAHAPVAHDARGHRADHPVCVRVRAPSHRRRGDRARHDPQDVPRELDHPHLHVRPSAAPPHAAADAAAAYSYISYSAPAPRPRAARR
jgi:hypothetical protein